MTHDAVKAWLDAYVQAWKTYDRQAISDLFAEDATYINSPYDESIRGREAIVAAWLENQDTPGTYDAHYAPVVVEGDRAVANGRSIYYQPDGKTLRAEYDNIFLLRFDMQNRCLEYREWYMARPEIAS